LTRFVSSYCSGDSRDLHSFPTRRSSDLRTMMGSTTMGMKHLGEENDSDGSDFIINMAEEDDERPIWISVWGGGNTFAQAIWRVQDRKSTRLNSSHVKISYAVFCLKKKKK